MTGPRYDFEAKLWLHGGQAGWTFLTLPGEVSDDIEARTSHRSTAFGSVRVRVTVGRTEWATSLFPDKRSQAYLLPVKKAVRRAERLNEGDDVAVSLVIVGDDESMDPSF
ncbi:MAG: DUF1905 domain-containing protein [Actinomycetota bacterium]|nr:DUF1905 domain-containing protein [Actinomycetota bacterium]